MTEPHPRDLYQGDFEVRAVIVIVIVPTGRGFEVTCCLLYRLRSMA